jgi:hypothetical protein
VEPRRDDAPVDLIGKIPKDIEDGAREINDSIPIFPLQLNLILIINAVLSI